MTTKMQRINALSIFLVTLTCFVWAFPRWADPNQNSRLDMVIAVVDDGTFQIDRYVANTVDYAKVGEHYYSDKAPGAAFLGMPVYAILSMAMDLPVLEQLPDRLANSEAFAGTLRAGGTGVSDEKVRFAMAQVALALMVSAVPTALLCALLYLVGSRLTDSASALLVALAYGLLTPALPYANAFYGHQLAAALLFAAFALVLTAPAKIGLGRLTLVGLLLGYSVVTEYPAALPAGLIFVYTWFMLVRRRQSLAIVWTLATGGIVAVLWLGYNTTVFGAPLELGYSHSELWMDEHSTGFMSLTIPTWEALWGITLSPFKGLFLLAPWLLLAAPGFVVWWRRGDIEMRAACATSLACVGSILLFTSASGMWWGGFAVGPRYLLPILPFLALACAFAFARWGKGMAFRGLSALLLIWSGAAVWSQTLADQAFPSDQYRNPWLQHVLPAWQKGNLARSVGTLLGLEGAWAFLPLLVVVLLLGLLWWQLAYAAATPRLVGESAEPAIGMKV